MFRYSSSLNQCSHHDKFIPSVTVTIPQLPPPSQEKEQNNNKQANKQEQEQQQKSIDIKKKSLCLLKSETSHKCY